MTGSAKASTLIVMGFAARVLIAILTVVLGSYALDCTEMATPEQAMQCCKSMNCPSQGHQGQDCCQSMPSVHATVGQPPLTQNVSASLIAVGMVHDFNQCDRYAFASGLIAKNSHAPPFLVPAPPSPLRI